MAETKVKVIHKHETGQGSTILAVVRANAAGERIAEAIVRNAERDCMGCDEISTDEVTVTEAAPISRDTHEVLAAVSKAAPLAPKLFRRVPLLIDAGYIEQVAHAGLFTLKLTAAGIARLASAQGEIE
jgi:hypothetical protein